MRTAKKCQVWGTCCQHFLVYTNLDGVDVDVGVVSCIGVGVDISHDVVGVQVVGVPTSVGVGHILQHFQPKTSLVDVTGSVLTDDVTLTIPIDVIIDILTRYSPFPRFYASCPYDVIAQLLNKRTLK